MPKRSGQKALPCPMPDSNSKAKVQASNSPLDLRAFWREHDRTLPETTNSDEITLSHNLYREMPGWFNAFYAHFQEAAVRRLVQMCKLPPRGRSLDVGCGTGRWTRLLLELGLQSFGIDIGEQALQLAASRWQSTFFSRIGLPYLGLASHSFDFALSVTVLQHIPHAQQQQAVEELARVICPEGYLLVCESIDTGDPSPYIFANQPERWLEMFHDAGFQLVGRSACEFLPYVKVFHWMRHLGRGARMESASEANVSRMARLLRTSIPLAALVHLVVIVSYPLEYIASRILPQRSARLACFLLRKT